MLEFLDKMVSVLILIFVPILGIFSPIIEMSGREYLRNLKGSKIPIYKNGRRKFIWIKVYKIEDLAGDFILKNVNNRLKSIYLKIKSQNRVIRKGLKEIYEEYNPYIFEIKKGIDNWKSDYKEAEKLDRKGNNYNITKNVATEEITSQIEKIIPIIDKLEDEVDDYIYKKELEKKDEEYIKHELFKKKTSKKNYFESVDQMKDMDVKFIMDKYKEKKQDKQR